ncbi:nucleotide exchange factor GrpE [Geothrix oryzisoli]|uniref:nucleotide exchange factor GrpE n=1 Tax=Geothrix oryzisoli TaxID=2922721 RepID=UPI001FAB44C4|nr:nucleotide exchange factor GrpE [Geothrix oryzisoli]
MTTGTPREPHDKPAPPSGEPEDVVDLSLDDALEGDLQSVADEVASVYPATAGDEADPTDLGEPRVDLESALTEAEKQMEEMLHREAELMDQHRRLAADFNNFRNRAQRDIAMAVEQAERKILLEMLPVLDNFERGLSASYQDVESFRAGVELIQKQFLEALRRMNVEAMPLKIGDAFDALHAEALTTFSDPNLPDGAVAAVYERGYSLKGQLLRPARVVVNRLQEPGKS